MGRVLRLVSQLIYGGKIEMKMLNKLRKLVRKVLMYEILPCGIEDRAVSALVIPICLPLSFVIFSYLEKSLDTPKQQTPQVMHKQTIQSKTNDRADAYQLDTKSPKIKKCNQCQQLQKCIQCGSILD